MWSVTVEGQQRFVISGLSRLTVPVALGANDPPTEGLRDHGEVVVLAAKSDQGCRYARLLEEEGIRIVYDDDRRQALRDHLMTHVTCVLALADDDKENFFAAADCHELRPDVPVVLRTLDSALADELEQVTHHGGQLYVRRAYDMSALAAPAFVARALSDNDSIVQIMTMRFGPDEISLCRLKIRDTSALRRMTAGKLAKKLDCAVIAWREGRAEWHVGNEGLGKLAGKEVIIGGPQHGVFRAARRNSVMFSSKKSLSVGWCLSTNQRKLLQWSMLPAALLILTAVVLKSISGNLSLIDALYETLLAAGGEATPAEPSVQVQILAFVAIFSWLILGGLLVSFITDMILVRRMGRQADDFRNHVVIGGLGAVGYRVARLLAEIDVPTVVVSSRAPDDRFVHQIHWHIPVLTGNIRLADDLERAGVERASCLIATTTEDLANIQACVHAVRLNHQSRRDIRTIARVFDEELNKRIDFKEVFGIDEMLAAVNVAAAAFVDAATDADAVRPFDVGTRPFIGLRYHIRCDRTLGSLVATLAQGATVLAWRRDRGDVIGPARLPKTYEKGDSLIIVGPEELVARLSTAN